MKKTVMICSMAIALTNCSTTKQNKVLPPANPTTYANSITASELKDMLYTFASDDFEGRLTGASGQKKAVNYLKQHYVDMQIPSALPNNEYFQKVPLETRQHPTTTLSLNGEKKIEYTDFITVGSVASQTLTTDDIVYVGYGIDDENYSDYNTIDVRGKIVLLKAGEPKNADGTYVTTKDTKETIWSKGRRARSQKVNVAKEKGAKGFIIINDESFPILADFYQKQVKSGAKGRISLIEKDANEFPVFMITENLAQSFYNDILTNDVAKPISARISYNIDTKTESIDSENVAAFIKGSEKPDEILVISAHLDHEGVKGGLVYNGADDDGSGTVAILEIAEAFKAALNDGYAPKRSILFLHVTGEEKGLLGSRHYTDNSPIFPLENTVADLNIDMIGRVDEKHKDNRNFVYLIGSDKLSTQLHDLSEAVNNKYTKIDLDYTFNDEKDPNRYYYRSDHYNFAKNNIPVIFYFNGTHADYHKPTDTPDKIEYDLLENRTRLVFYTAWEIANRDNRLVVDKK